MSVLVQKEFPSNKKQEKYFFFSSRDYGQCWLVVVNFERFIGRLAKSFLWPCVSCVFCFFFSSPSQRDTLTTKQNTTKGQDKWGNLFWFRRQVSAFLNEIRKKRETLYEILSFLRRNKLLGYLFGLPTAVKINCDHQWRYYSHCVCIYFPFSFFETLH